jgi:ribonuclease G
VSVRIDDEGERARLIALVEGLVGPEAEFGFIIRTNAEGIDQAALAHDLDYLKKRWQRIQRDQAQAEAGECIYEELSLPFRALRDLTHARTDKVRIDDEATYHSACAFANEFFPNFACRIEHYTATRPLFDLYDVESEIERALSRTTPLKSGGHLVIDQTEAMTTVDVNTGGYVGLKNPEETIFKTNLEAAQAIARQLRLRNLGGIVIVDFIDMSDEAHKQQVLRVLNDALERDPARTSVSEISALGLVEMTRKRTTESLEHRLCEPCGVCSGSGRVKSVETMCSEIFREVVRATRQFETGQLQVMAAQPVIDRILDEHEATIAELAEKLGASIRFQAHQGYAQDQFDVVLL